MLVIPQTATEWRRALMSTGRPSALDEERAATASRRRPAALDEVTAPMRAVPK